MSGHWIICCARLSALNAQSALVLLFAAMTRPEETSAMFSNPRTLMIQGTTSDAGKTTLVAGLCRVFARAGAHVSPFKPQNMALNSAVTEDGGEIGRSQALQACACGLQPHTDMNPILLKPNSDTGAQVIVQGKALDSMEAKAYQRFKSTAINYALQSYRRLHDQYELILVEGAGSPAEINLRENDVANMGFAEAVDCPVILLADIDRGGVFAHLVGTLELLSPSEQNRVVGFVINRFRGDIKLLENGLDWLEERTGKPVLGVLPYLHGLTLDQEDAIDTQQTDSPEESTPGAPANWLTQKSSRLTIRVPVLPRISNHTDFDVLRIHPQVDLEFVGREGSLDGADLILLPGSKSVRADLTWLKERGFDRQIQKHLRYGGKLIGICGGFQMLGKSIADPFAIEGAAGTESGLGYLDMITELQQQKQLANVSGTLLLDGQKATVEGYEIHCGQSQGSAFERPLVRLQDRPEGAVSEDGQIVGTYLHGLFDHPHALQALLVWAGLSEPEKVDRNALREQQIERLADSVQEHIDWQKFASATGIKFEKRSESNSFDSAPF